MKTTNISPLTLPGYKEIPDVGLFLDQVVKYINSYFEAYPQLMITNAMVSNYVKQKLIPSPIKKAYGRDQIASLFFIAISKPVLSLDHIRVSLKIATESMENEDAYNEFVGVFTRALKEPLSLSVNEENSYEWALHHIVSTVVHKLYLDVFFETEIEKNK